MRATRKLIIFAIASLTACSSAPQSSNRHYQRAPLSLQTNTVAVADWVGALYLPLPEERREDGGIWMSVLEAPAEHQEMLGKKIWLKWNERDPERRAKYRARFLDVNFCEAADKILSIPPPPVLRTRVNGWSKVSPLESLAASHATDDVIASFSLEQITVGESSSLEASTEPVIVSGPRESVIRFKRKVSDSEFVVETVSATPAEFNLNLNLRQDPIASRNEILDHDKFLSSPHNQKGWIVQGFNGSNGIFDAYAVSPYEQYTVNMADFESIEDKRDFEKNRVWDLSLPNGSLKKQMTGVPAGYVMQEGDEFLLVHSYGYYDERGTVLGMSRGHLALGWAKVIRNQITGDLVLRPGNWQIYYNSLQGLVSCKYDEISYNGDLFRGKSFFRPISDVYVPLKTLNGNNRAWDLYAKPYLEEAMLDNFANTRLGYGGGYVMETIVTNCAHDTANIFIKTIQNVMTNMDHGDPNYRMYKRLKKELGPYVDIPDVYRACDRVQRWYGLHRGIANGKSVIPRRVFDAAVKGFTRGGAPVLNVKSMMITQEGTPMKMTAPYPIVLGDILWRLLTSPFTNSY